MAIVRWDPFKDLLSVQERINKIFDETVSNDANMRHGDWDPPVDIYETDRDIILTLEIPGTKEEDVDIQVNEGMLVVKGEKKVPYSKNENNFYRLERPYGKFSRSFSLPNNVDLEGIKAKLKDGILAIRISKKNESKPVTIKVDKED